MTRSVTTAAAFFAAAITAPQSPLSAADHAPDTPLPHLDLDSQARARTAVSLQGRVVDPSDRGVATAVVYAVYHPGSFPASPPSAKTTRTIADESGRFVFSDLPPGRYVLVAIHGHHSPGHSDPVVVGHLGMPVPIRILVGDRSQEV